MPLQPFAFFTEDAPENGTADKKTGALRHRLCHALRIR